MPGVVLYVHPLTPQFLLCIFVICVIGLWNGKKRVAVKEINKDAVDYDAFSEEANILKDIGPHTNLVQLLAVCSKEVKFYYENN